MRVFISYKREDALSAARLVRALEKDGISVWWDQGLSAGEQWRTEIETALDNADVVIVLWSSESVGPRGQFVRDEASRAATRGVLVPVLIEKVSPPLGFGELQSIDLRRWRGDRGQAVYGDLLSAISAKAQGTTSVRAKAPAMRLYRRLSLAATSVGALAGIALFLTDTGGLQEGFCTLPLAQPWLSDACSTLHWGARPSAAERTAWESKRPGNCDDLRTIAEKPGYYQTTAAAMLARRQVTPTGPILTKTREWRSYVRTSNELFTSLAAAQHEVSERALEDARVTGCAPSSLSERVVDVTISDIKLDCRTDPIREFACSADYVAACRIEFRAPSEVCS